MRGQRYGKTDNIYLHTYTYIHITRAYREVITVIIVVIVIGDLTAGGGTALRLGGASLDVHLGFFRAGRRLVRHGFVDSSCHLHEEFIDVDVVLGGGFDERDTELGGQFLTFLHRHLSVVLLVALVADEEELGVLGGILLHGVVPCLEMLEGGSFSHVVDNRNTHGPSVVRGGDGSKSFLAGRVPDLELDTRAVEVDGLDLKVDTNGGDELRVELLVHKTNEQARLTDAGVTDHEQLHGLVELFSLGGHFRVEKARDAT